MDGRNNEPLFDKSQIFVNYLNLRKSILTLPHNLILIYLPAMYIMVKIISIAGCLFAGLALLVLKPSQTIYRQVTTSDPIAGEIITNQKSRIKDAWGVGLYGASREERLHKGLDIVAQPGDRIVAPFIGDNVREAVPYSNDPSYRGIVIKGIDDWTGYEMKVFYVEGLLSGRIVKGQEIGTVQNLTIRYPGITNHIHVEVKKNGVQIDPFDIWQMSF
jgi:murein DD-endopeptidase MepM/ murein hydrolase activator NlpD